jgi:hypothetical protein
LINPADIPPSLWDPGDPRPIGPEPEGDFFMSLSEAEQDALLGREIAERVRSGKISSLNPGILRLMESAEQEPEV